MRRTMIDSLIEQKIHEDLLFNMVMAMIEQDCPMDTPIPQLEGVTLGDLFKGFDETND